MAESKTPGAASGEAAPGVLLAPLKAQARNQPSSNASSDSFSPRTRSNMASRSGTSMPRRSSPDTSSTTWP
ncbi:hypothetical protein CNMCM8686_000655 [Aspergillus fumigatus]|nr:hypothetical protein CNMCM8686_000655 [Aspergillus fumigatus]